MSIIHPKAPFVALAFAALPLAGCIETGVKQKVDPGSQTAGIEVTPLQISFGGLAPGETATEVFEVRSVGNESLRVDGIRLQGSPAYTLQTDLESSQLEPGESREVIVTYTPTNVEDEAIAVVLSNDPVAPEVLVRLDGAGLWPQLTIEPALVDFGLNDPGTVTTTDVALVNTGGAPLDLYTAAVVGETFTLSGFLPQTLQPGEETAAQVTFSPLLDGFYQGELWVSSNDPSETDRAEIRGTTLEQPIAVCSASPPEAFALYDAVTWIGRESYDPSGHTITDYEWGLIAKPTGSSAQMPPGDADRTNFYADVVGEYVAQLVVTNDVGVSSEPCIATLAAEPSQDLWVEMYWVHSGDDMDLHLVRGGGSLWGGDDCNWQNCVGRGLDWGISGDSADDPSLDIDDIGGAGPENINIFNPTDPSFEVHVHDYPGSTYSGGNDVTVNIYMLGELEWTDTRTISGEDSMTHFATINWDDKSVTGQ